MSEPVWKKKESAPASAPTVEAAPKEKPVIASVTILLHPDGTYTAQSKHTASLPMAAALSDFSSRMIRHIDKELMQAAMQDMASQPGLKVN